jgi:hypothetical protein
MPNFADTNIAPATRTITYQVVNGGPIKTPTLTEPLFTSRVNPNFGSLSAIVSNVNSTYNAIVAQVNHRMSHHIQFSANYTWAHAIDFGQNQTTFTDTNDFLVPGNERVEKGNSIYDVRHRFVLRSIITAPWKKQGWVGVLANDWEMDPIYQVQTGLPYSVGVSGGAVPGALFSGINGSGGGFPARVDVTGRNSFHQPTTWVSDIRIAKHFRFQEKYELELIGDFFNLANKQNVTAVNTTGYFSRSSGTVPTPSGPVTCTANSPCLDYFNPDTGIFSSLFGTITNTNSNFVYSPRQIQIGVRVKF